MGRDPTSSLATLDLEFELLDCCRCNGVDCTALRSDGKLAFVLLKSWTRKRQFIQDAFFKEQFKKIILNNGIPRFAVLSSKFNPCKTKQASSEITIGCLVFAKSGRFWQSWEFPKALYILTF